MTVSEKVAYIKGLAEGLGIDGESKQVKLFKAIIDVLEDIAFSDVEEFVFGPDECDDDECCCDDDDEDDDDEDSEYGVTCPACGAEIEVSDEDIDAGEMDCPACGEHLEFEFDDDDEEDEDEEDDD